MFVGKDADARRKTALPPQKNKPRRPPEKNAPTPGCFPLMRWGKGPQSPPPPPLKKRGGRGGGAPPSTHKTKNGQQALTDAPAQTPLLWVIREGLKLTGTKFGCGTGLCGACMVHIDGKRAFSCQTQVSEVAGSSVTTIEGLSPDSSHPLQKAWLAERVPQCGYCQSGQIMSAAALLKEKPKPTRAEIVEHMSANICRCGTYQRIVRAVERAAREA